MSLYQQANKAVREMFSPTDYTRANLTRFSSLERKKFNKKF